MRRWRPARHGAMECVEEAGFPTMPSLYSSSLSPLSPSDAAWPGVGVEVGEQRDGIGDHGGSFGNISWTPISGHHQPGRGVPANENVAREGSIQRTKPFAGRNPPERPRQPGRPFTGPPPPNFIHKPKKRMRMAKKMNINLKKKCHTQICTQFYSCDKKSFGKLID